MKKIFLILVFVLAFAVQGWGATYYVRSDGSDGNSGLDFTNAKASWNGADTVATDDDIVIFAAGTYTNALNYGRNWGAQDITIRAATEIDDSSIAGWDAGYAGTPIIDIAGNNEHIMYFLTAGKTVTITGLEIRNATVNSKNGVRLGAAMTLNLNDFTIRDCSRGIENYGGATVTWNKGELIGGQTYPDSFSVYIRSLPAIMTFNFVKFLPSQKYLLPPMLCNVAGCTINLNNCASAGAQERFARVTAISTFNITNHNSLGWALSKTFTDQFDVSGGGTINVTYTNAINNTRNLIKDPFDDGDVGVNSMSVDAKVTGLTGIGYLGINVDDGSSLEYAEQVAEVCESYGTTMMFFPSQAQVSQLSDYAARLQALVNSGHDIGGHAYSDTDLTQAGPIDIDGPGASSTVEKSGNDIFLDATNDGTPEQTFVIGVDGTTVSELVTWINTFSGDGWTARKVGGSLTDIDDAALLTGMQDTETTTATGAWTTVPWLIDATGNTGHYKNEITDPKAWLESVIQTDATGIAATYALDYFAYPKGRHNKDVINTVVVVGFLGSRGFEDTSDTSDLRLGSSIATETGGNIYRLYGISHLNFDNETEAVVKYNAYCMAMYAVQGTLNFLITHSTSQISLERLGWILDTWNDYSGVNISTPKKLLDIIRDGASLWEYIQDDTTNGGKIWGLKSGSELPEQFNFTDISPSSILNHAGTTVSGIPTTDLNGDEIRGLWPIGPYQERNNRVLCIGCKPGIGLNNKWLFIR